MSPLLALGLLVAGLCSSVHCLPGGGLDPEDVTPDDQHKGAPVDDHTFISSNTDFAFSLYKQLALKTSNENVIFSPLSVSMTLAFLSLGARGPTLMETLEGLKFNLTETPETEIHQGFQHLLQMLGRPSDQLQLSLGNAMFVQEQLKLLDKFREDARALCASKAFSTDFRDSDTAKKLINDYVRNKTQGKIVELFKNVSQSTVMVLVNYVYFKDQGAPRMEIGRWWLLITVFMAVAHCLALVNQEDSDLTNSSPQDSLGLPQNLREQPEPTSWRAWFNLNVGSEAQIQKGFQDLLLRYPDRGPVHI
uniref:Serpin domain-containing protein n=1 Tax=Monodon monoceros TaxID=40151 RepID=A0A8C6BU75_MONMO